MEIKKLETPEDFIITIDIVLANLLRLALLNETAFPFRFKKETSEKLKSLLSNIMVKNESDTIAFFNLFLSEIGEKYEIVETETDNKINKYNKKFKEL